jgi:glycosyltransferase 2 family protein
LLKKLLVTALKIVASLGILAYLVFRAVTSEGAPEAIDDIRVRLGSPEVWGLLTAAWVVVMAAIVVTMVRWCYLVRALGIPLPMRDALRIGFLGFLFNLAPMGIVGGDLLKAVMLAKEYPGNRAKSLASVIFDRMIGLYVLFVVASAGILLTGSYWSVDDRDVHAIYQGTLLLTLIGTAGIAILMLPGLTNGKWTAAAGRIPYAGHMIASLLAAMQMYRRNWAVLLGSAALTVAVHVLAVLSVYLTTAGLTGNTDLVPQFAVYPISSVASTVPLPAGPQEAVLAFLLIRVMKIEGCSAIAVPLVFRLLNVLIAAVGFFYYLGSRREVSEVMHEAEEEEEIGEQAWEAAESQQVEGARN